MNWNVFKTKFHQREQASFASLAYMLFCYEYGITKGIFRFKNQTGIETEPIDHHGVSTGFQAKFYETKLFTSKKDIIDSLKKAIFDRVPSSYLLCLALPVLLFFGLLLQIDFFE